MLYRSYPNNINWTSSGHLTSLSLLADMAPSTAPITRGFVLKITKINENQLLLLKICIFLLSKLCWKMFFFLKIFNTMYLSILITYFETFNLSKTLKLTTSISKFKQDLWPDIGYYLYCLFGWSKGDHHTAFCICQIL